MQKIMITGATGFVGNALMRYYPMAVAAPSLRQLTEENIEKIVNESQTDVIIHTAAISDIGQCQKFPEESQYANVTIPVFLAKACKKTGTKLIAFSSDQVYSGSEEAGPFNETKARPGNLYAQEKLEMETRVLEIAPESVLLRAEWMYDYVSNKGNYFLNVLRADVSLAFSSRQFRGVTYVREVAAAMDQVMNLPGGVYNFGSETNQNIHEITKEFLEFLGKELPVFDQGNGKNLWMDCSKARNDGVFFSDVLDALKKCWEDYRKSESRNSEESMRGK